MKKQSGSAVTGSKSSVPVKAAKVPVMKRPRTTDGTSTQEEEKTRGSSSQQPDKTPSPLNDGEMEVAATTGEVKEGSNGHKSKKMADVLNSCHKTKYLPLGDGMFTTNVYFQPLEVVEAKRSWVDVKMREIFIGGGVMESAEPHVYSMEADDLLRMLYLGEMFANETIGIERTSFEQWVLDIFSKVIAEDSHADYSDRGRIASYALTHAEPLSLGDNGHIQYLFQKRCIYDFEDVSSNVTLCGENNMAVKTKSSRGKFEYMIELHVACLPSQTDEDDEVEMKRRNEEGTVPEMK